MNMGFGIATGDIFITCFGDSLRREFAMVGDVVNSAARTAAIASKGGSILLGKSTWDAIHTRVGCVKLPPVKVKGKKQVRLGPKSLGEKEVVTWPSTHSYPFSLSLSLFLSFSLS